MGGIEMLTDQPILGRCGLCDHWVIYVVEKWSNSRSHPKYPGHILEPVATKGGKWAMIRGDGRVAPNRDPSRWGEAPHRCRKIERPECAECGCTIRPGRWICQACEWEADREVDDAQRDREDSQARDVLRDLP